MKGVTMSRDYDLKLEKRDKLVGFKVTPTEHKELLEFCDNKGISVSRFIRYIVMDAMTNEKK
jgi:hypothetical protein